MAGLTNDIEKFLKELLEETNDGSLEIGRNDLACKFNCAPSQINYVLQTRFTPYNGYIIESRRGGGGFIKITMLVTDEEDYITHILKNIKDELTRAQGISLLEDLVERDYISEKEEVILRDAISDRALKNVDSDKRKLVRADILKNILISFLRRS